MLLRCLCINGRAIVRVLENGSIQIKFVHVFVSLIMIMLLALDRFIVISARDSFNYNYTYDEL